MRLREAMSVPRVALLVLFAVILSAPVARTQSLIPAAYTPAPVGFNFLTVAATFNKGDILFDPSLPIEDARATIGVAAIGIGRTLNIAGRYANIGVIVPYAHGRVEGLLLGQFEQRTRSGQGDLGARIAINLYGAPAMTPTQFGAYRAKTIVGLGLNMAAPIGQYDSTRVINIGTHRWAFTPEIGISRTRGKWMVEGDFSGSFFTDNTNYFNGGTRQQAPIACVQGHLVYTIRRGLWVAADANFWRGGRVTTNGTEATHEQHNSRVGTTLALPVGRQQVRVSYSFGAYTRTGGDFHSIGFSYSYAWTRRQP